MRIIVFILAICFISNRALGQGRQVDKFKVNKQDVVVFFYDPLDSLTKLDTDFQERSDKEKSTALDRYLHEHPLYLFRLTNRKTNDIIFLCIRGNPEKVNTKMFYKLEVIKGEANGFNPNASNYLDQVVQTFDNVNCGGTLFENMTLFDSEEGKMAVGKGIQLYGYYRRVQPYSEIKESVEKIIKQL
jgi:hypothetical protein